MVNKKQTAVVAFIPVLHQGYIDFLKKYRGPVYIFGDTFIKRFTSLVRDLRIVPPQKMVELIRSLKIVPKVSVFDQKAVKAIKKARTQVVMPDEDVSREIAQTEFVGLNVRFEKVFLRWNKTIVVKEYEPPVGRIVSQGVFEKEMMLEAHKEAERSADWWRKIGAILVKDGKIVGRAFNKHLPSKHHTDTFGDPRSNFNAGERYDLVLSIHAEAALVAEAARNGKGTKGASLFVTTFPCPVCARLICEAGIKKVYYRTGYSLMDAEKIMKYYGVEIILVD